MLKIIPAIIFCLFLSSAFAAPADLETVKAEFKSIDTDTDGFITAEEMEVYQAVKFEEADKDKNGLIDANEVSVDTTKVLQQQNVEGISKEQSNAAFKQYFDQMDKDKDNKISEAEYTDYWKVIYNF